MLAGVEAPNSTADRRARGRPYTGVSTGSKGARCHGNFDAVLFPPSRSQAAPHPVAFPAASWDPAIAPTHTVRVAQERAPPRASQEAADPSHPRAPPHAWRLSREAHGFRRSSGG